MGAATTRIATTGPWGPSPTAMIEIARILRGHAQGVVSTSAFELALFTVRSS